MTRKIYRKIFEKLDTLTSKIRIIHLRIKYPKLSISWNSYVGKNCKIVCLDDSKMEINNVYISKGCTITSNHGAEVKIAKGYIGPYSTIVARQKIIINSHFSIAEMVVIRDQNHRFDLSDELLEKQGFESAPIIIGTNVWIAAKATILKGVTIGDNVVVGAHALVNKKITSNSVAVGIPAKKIKAN